MPLPARVSHAALALSFASTLGAQMWVQRTPSVSPPARANPGMVYDSDRCRVVLFGGRDPTIGKDYDDTWEYDGNTWTLVPTADKPSGRHGHVMAYDSHRKRTVLFGGGTIDAIRQGDTWEYDGCNWRSTLR